MSLSVPVILQPQLKKQLNIADKIGYPIIVRPAFTMGGTGGGICDTEEELREIVANGTKTFSSNTMPN